VHQVELNNFLYNYSYFTLFWLSFGYFLVLYFVLAPLFNWVCELLYAKKILHKIVLKEISKKQILFIENKTLIYLIFAIIPILFQSCQKEKAENSLEGNWIVNSTKTKTELDTYHPLAVSPCGDQIVFSGELFLNEYGNGHAKIYGTYCDSTFLLFDKNINDLRIEKHYSKEAFQFFTSSHSYSGFFNDDIQFICSSLSDRGKIKCYTNEINFIIGSSFNLSTGVVKENYNLFLVLTRQ